MRKTMVIVLSAALIAAACGSDDETGDTSAASTTAEVSEEPPASEPPPTDPPATDPPVTEPPATDPPVTDPPPTDPPPTEAPATTEPPPTPVNAVGLVPLPGQQLDFQASAVPNPSLVWSLYSGSGGIIVENIGGPLPPGCHGTSFFDPVTLDLLEIGGAEANAYAAVGVDGCANMNQPSIEPYVDGEAVAAKTDQFILFDFGTLPGDPFDVSTQVVNPEGDDGVFRASDPLAPLFDNRLDDTDLTHVIGADVLFEVLDGGDLALVQPPLPEPGNCIDFDFCLFDRFGVDVVGSDLNAGQVLVSSEKAGLFTFLDDAEWKALVRIVNGCQFNDHFWVFAAASTGVEFDLTVTDTTTGESRSYFNPLDNLPEPITDTSAFATCP